MSSRGQYGGLGQGQGRVHVVGASLLHTLELKQRYNNAKTASVQALLNDLSSQGTVSTIGTNRWEVALKDGAWVQILWYPDNAALEITITDRELRRVNQSAGVRPRYEAILHKITPQLSRFGVTTVGAFYQAPQGYMIGMSPEALHEDLERLNDEVRAFSEKLTAQRVAIEAQSPLGLFYEKRWAPFVRSWRYFYDDLKDTSTFLIAHRSKTVEKALSDWQLKLIDVRADAAVAGLNDLSPPMPIAPPGSTPSPSPFPVPGSAPPPYAANQAPPAGDRSNTGLYVALGVGALAAVGVFMAYRHSEAA